MYNVSFELLYLYATPYYYPSPDAIEFKKICLAVLEAPSIALPCLCSFLQDKCHPKTTTVRISPPVPLCCHTASFLHGTERLRPHALKHVLDLQQLAFAANVDISAAQKLQW